MPSSVGTDLQIHVWFDEKQDVIKMRIAGELTSVKNDPNSKRGNPSLYKKLAAVLRDISRRHFLSYLENVQRVGLRRFGVVLRGWNYIIGSGYRADLNGPAILYRILISTLIFLRLRFRPLILILLHNHLNRLSRQLMRYVKNGDLAAGQYVISLRLWNCTDLY